MPENRRDDKVQGQDSMNGIICYCFGYSREDIRRDVREHDGASTILGRIIEDKRQGGCACAVHHPLGR